MLMPHSLMMSRGKCAASPVMMILSSVASATARKGRSAAAGSFTAISCPRWNPAAGNAARRVRMADNVRPNFRRERTSRYSARILLSQAGTKRPAIACCSTWSQMPPGVIAAETSTFVSTTQWGTVTPLCVFYARLWRHESPHRCPPWSIHCNRGAPPRAGLSPEPVRVSNG